MSVIEVESKPTDGVALERSGSLRKNACDTPVSRHRRPRRLPTGTVLWIDDDPTAWARGAEHLMRCGYKVVPIPPTARGTQWVAAIAPDVIVLEVNLEDADGMNLLRAIRAENARLPILIYSRTDRYRDDFTSWLADDYLLKADDVAPLCDAIEAVLAAHRGRAG